VRGKGAGCSRGGARAFIGAGDVGEMATWSNDWSNGLTSWMAGARLRGVEEEF
jgi:hypothetical protein